MNKRFAWLEFAEGGFLGAVIGGACLGFLLILGPLSTATGAAGTPVAIVVTATADPGRPDYPALLEAANLRIDELDRKVDQTEIELDSALATGASLQAQLDAANASLEVVRQELASTQLERDALDGENKTLRSVALGEAILEDPAIWPTCDGRDPEPTSLNTLFLTDGQVAQIAAICYDQKIFENDPIAQGWEVVGRYHTVRTPDVTVFRLVMVYKQAVADPNNFYLELSFDWDSQEGAEYLFSYRSSSTR